MKKKFTEHLTWYLSVLAVAAGLLVTFGSITYQRHAYGRPQQVDLTQMEPAGAAFAYELAPIEARNGYFYLEGWALQRGRDIRRFDTKLALLDEASGESYVFRTAMRMREDVTQEQDDGCDYDACGFAVTIDGETLSSGTYRVALCCPEYTYDKRRMVKKTTWYLLLTDQVLKKEA